MPRDGPLPKDHSTNTHDAGPMARMASDRAAGRIIEWVVNQLDVRPSFRPLALPRWTSSRRVGECVSDQDVLHSLTLRLRDENQDSLGGRVSGLQHQVVLAMMSNTLITSGSTLPSWMTGMNGLCCLLRLTFASESLVGSHTNTAISAGHVSHPVHRRWIHAAHGEIQGNPTEDLNTGTALRTAQPERRSTRGGSSAPTRAFPCLCQYRQINGINRSPGSVGFGVDVHVDGAVQLSAPSQADECHQQCGKPYKAHSFSIPSRQHLNLNFSDTTMWRAWFCAVVITPKLELVSAPVE